MPKSRPPTDQTPGQLLPKERQASKQTQRLLDQIVAAAQARQDGEQEQITGLRPLIMCGIPLRRIQEAFYSRRNGPYLVELSSTSALGLPYGQDRLVLIFLATLFSAMGCPKDNKVRFIYARDILRPKRF